MAEERKNVFENAWDKITGQKENKETAEEALDKAQQEIERLRAEAVKARQDAQKWANQTSTAKVEANQAVVAAEARAREAEKKLEELSAKLEELQKQEGSDKQQALLQKLRGMREQTAKPAEAVAAVQPIAEHEVVAGETLSHISLKYYGSAAKPFYMYIYEANKAAIGDNPNMVRAGTKLNIPTLSEELKQELK